MKFSERFLKVPVRVYDVATSEKNYKKKEELGEDDPYDGDWIRGQIRIQHSSICAYGDYYDCEQGIEGVEKKGFKNTIILMNDGSSYICTMDKDKFTEVLDAYADKYEKWIEEMTEQQMKSGIRLTL